MNIKNRDKLLSDLIEKVIKTYVEQNRKFLSRRIDIALWRFGLIVITDDGASFYDFGLLEGLSILINDLYWDERGNWSNASKVELMPI